jgi:hypothetical protein
MRTQRSVLTTRVILVNSVVCQRHPGRSSALRSTVIERSSLAHRPGGGSTSARMSGSQVAARHESGPGPQGYVWRHVNCSLDPAPSWHPRQRASQRNRSEALSAGVPPGDDRLANRDDVDRQRYGQAGRTRTGANWSLPTRQPMTWSLAMGARRDMAKDPRAVKSALRRLHHPEESSVLAL